MAISYDLPNNKIIVTGYSLATPANFTDLFNADKAGTLSLHARTGIAGTDGAAVATDRAERPADYVVLGGASNDLYITVANWNGTTATIRITGTDRDGTAQTEDIVVNANGQYNTTKWFKTITHTQVTAFTATSFDYDLTQGQWGVVESRHSSEYHFSCKLVIGDGNAAYFTDIGKQITFADGIVTGHNQGLILVSANAIFQSGTLISESAKITEFGCSFTFLENTYHTSYFFIGAGTIYLYSSSFFVKNYAGRCNLNKSITHHRIWNSSIFGYFWFAPNNDDNDAYNLIINCNEACVYNPAGTIDKIIGVQKPSWLVAAAGSKMSNMTHNRSSASLYTFYVWAISVDVELTNVIFNFPVKINWQGQIATAKIWMFFTTEFLIIDSENNPLQSCSISVKNSHNEYSGSTGIDGKLSTPFTVKEGYYHYDTGDTIQEKEDYTIEIKKAGYQTYKKKFTLGSKIDWTIKLSKQVPVILAGGKSLINTAPEDDQNMIYN